MKENLLNLLHHAYAPYSNFKVACIVKMHNNQEFIGVNVENPSFKNGLCAEQVAIAAAIAEGYNKEDFNEMHVMGSSDEITVPCFLCRQLLVEFFPPEAKIICYNKDGELKEYKRSDLTPHAFEYEEVSDGK